MYTGSAQYTRGKPVEKKNTNENKWIKGFVSLNGKAVIRGNLGTQWPINIYQPCWKQYSKIGDRFSSAFHFFLLLLSFMKCYGSLASSCFPSCIASRFPMCHCLVIYQVLLYHSMCQPIHSLSINELYLSHNTIFFTEYLFALFVYMTKDVQDFMQFMMLH